MEQKIKHRGLPDLEFKEKTPSSFPLKIEYLILSRIESGAKAFIDTTEVPVKIRQNKHTNKQTKKNPNFSKRKLRKKPLGGYYLPINYIFTYSFSQRLLTEYSP